MDLARVKYPSGVLSIDGYGPGFFRIGGKLYDGAVIVSSDGVIPWAGIEDYPPLLALAGKVDVLFLGMGAEISLLPGALAKTLQGSGMMAEPMSSPAAARSYNVLLAEGRRVACALVPV